MKSFADSIALIDHASLLVITFSLLVIGIIKKLVETTTFH